MTLFWCKFGFGKCFRFSSLSSHWAGHHWLSYKIYFLKKNIYFLLHITIQPRNGLLLLCRIRDDASKWFFYQLMRHPLIFIFPICFKCWMTVEWLMLSSMATSCAVVRGSGLMIALNWLLSTSDGWPAFLIFKALISFENLFNHYYAVCSLAVPGPGCWCWELSPLLYDPFWIGIKKVARICFLSI